MQKSVPINNFKLISCISSILLLITQASCKHKANKNEIIIATAGKISSVDPAQASTFHALQLISSLGDPLYKVNKQGNLDPVLALAAPEITNYGLTISIPLRKDVLFHDGTEFNSYAMKFTINRFLKIGTLSYLIGDRIKSIETPEKFLLRIQLKRPSSSLEKLLTSINLTPLSPEAYKSHKESFLNKKFIGTGPYILKSFTPQQQKLEPFKKYWGRKALNNGVTLINLNNSTSLLSSLRIGEIDVLLSNSIDEDQRFFLHRMSQKGLFKEGIGESLEIGYITFKSNKGSLKNLGIRKALMYSIDRELVSQRVSYGLRKPLRSLIPPSLNNGMNSTWPKYDPIKARDLLKVEGYCSKRELEINLSYRSNVPADKLLALTWKELTKRDLKGCLNLKLNGVESTTIYRQLSQGSYEAVMLDWRGSYPDPEAYLTPLLSCKLIKETTCLKGEAASSGSFWASPLIEKQLTNSDKIYGEKRIKKLKEIEINAARGSAYLPVWLESPRAWSQKYISEPEFNKSGQLLLHRLRKTNNE